MSRRRCCCTPAPDPFGAVIRVSTCGFLRPGVTVEIYTNSARTVLLASGVTDASGEYHYGAASGGARYAWVPAINSRIQSAGVSFAASTFFPIVAVSPPAASGYTCSGLCADPIANTINGTVSLLGAVVLSRVGGSGWASPGVAYGYPGCVTNSCPPASLILRAFWDGINTLSIQSLTFTSAGCPLNASGTTYSASAPMARLSHTCPPSFFASFQRVPGVGFNFADMLQCGATFSGTISE